MIGPRFPEIPPDILPLYSFPLLLLLSAVACVVVTLLTPPDSMEDLAKFYRNVRPWGWWGPVKQHVLALDPSFRVNKNFRRDAFNVVIGTAVQTALVALPMYVVHPAVRWASCVSGAHRDRRGNTQEDVVRPSRGRNLMAGRATIDAPRAAERALGYFDTAAREYVITTPMTPLPWLNYLGSNGFYSLISNTCGGYSFYRDAKLRRLTRYRYDSVPLDSTGKYLYVVDGESAPWNPGWRPTRTPFDSYECRHGLGTRASQLPRTVLLAELTVFVADQHEVEIQALTLTNNTARLKSVRLFSYVEWCQWNAEDDAANLQRTLSLGETYVEDGIVCHITGYRERRNHYAYHAVSGAASGSTRIETLFWAPTATLHRPRSSARASRRARWLPVGGPLRPSPAAVTLSPGQTQTVVFATGYAENSNDRKVVAGRVRRTSQGRARSRS